MSYEGARRCLADAQRFAPAAAKPYEFDLVSALANLTDAIEADMRETHRQLRALKEAVEDLQRRK